MTTGSTSYMPKSFVEGLLWKSVPQSKVAARLRLNVLCCCTSEACKYSIRSAVVMAAAMTSCSTAILAAKTYCRSCTYSTERFTSALQEWFMSKWWQWSKVEAWNFTVKTFKTCHFNESRLFICRLKSQHNCSGENTRNMHVSWMML